MWIVLEADGNATTFSETLLNIGNGTQQKTSSTIVIHFFFANSISGTDNLISKVYPGVSEIP